MGTGAWVGSSVPGAWQAGGQEDGVPPKAVQGELGQGNSNGVQKVGEVLVTQNMAETSCPPNMLHVPHPNQSFLEME